MNGVRKLGFADTSDDNYLPNDVIKLLEKLYNEFHKKIRVLIRTQVPHHI